MSIEQQKTNLLGKYFVDFSLTKPVVVVCTPISPFSIFFSYSRLLLSGKFTCEMDIFDSGNIRQAFKDFKLIRDFTDEEARKVVNNYWQRELFHLPINSRNTGHII